MLGTHSCNALITSSIRLDVKGRVSVGGVTSSFRPQNDKESLATRIFLDQKSISAGLKIAQNEHATYVSSKLKTEQDCPLRSEFDDGSTYLRFMLRDFRPGDIHVFRTRLSLSLIMTSRSPRIPAQEL